MKTVIILLICVGSVLASSIHRAKRQNYGTRNCFYSNGFVVDKGVTRPATQSEKRHIQWYENERRRWTREFDEFMNNKFSSGFPFNKDSAPKRTAPRGLPEVPCFCSPRVCAGY